MGLKDFLKKQGFIEEDADDLKNEDNSNSGTARSSENVAPTYFPFADPAGTASAGQSAQEPSFVSPVQQTATQQQDIPDPTFVKFFEDELVKANLPGPDYFEFRQSLMKTQQKMAAKGVVAPDVVLQAVLTSFEAQDLTPEKLIETAKKYKDVIKQKNDSFISGAEAEKNNQLQKRQSVLQQHNDNIARIEQQLQQLEQQKQQLTDALNKEKTQLDVNKTLGKEGIEKIDRAEKLIAVAHSYMQSVIDTDIKRLQSV